MDGWIGVAWDYANVRDEKGETRHGDLSKSDETQATLNYITVHAIPCHAMRHCVHRPSCSLLTHPGCDGDASCRVVLGGFLAFLALPDGGGPVLVVVGIRR